MIALRATFAKGGVRVRLTGGGPRAQVQSNCGSYGLVGLESKWGLRRWRDQLRIEEAVRVSNRVLPAHGPPSGPPSVASVVSAVYI